MNNKPSTNIPSTIQVESMLFQTIKTINENLHKITQAQSPVQELVGLATKVIGCSNCLLLTMNPDDAMLEYAAAHPPLEAPEDENSHTVKPAIFINTFNADANSYVTRIQAGEQLTATESVALDGTRLQSLGRYINVYPFTLMPLLLEGRLLGLIGFYNADTTPLTPKQKQIIQTIAPSLSSLLSHAQHTMQLNSALSETAREMEIFRRIDGELADVIELDYVFRMTMDWALRFTNADAAALSLYNHETDTVRVTAHYGYRKNALPIDVDLQANEGGITLRVARSGVAEIVPNVSLDKDYYPASSGTRTQLTAPIMREEKVIAVIALESKKLNGFTEENLEFVRKLTNRAGVAVDNARLFTETRREREKLQHILKNIADIVIAVGVDNRILLINYSALLALHLSVDDVYIGRLFSDVITHSKLQTLFTEAAQGEDTVADEIELPNGRVYHIQIDSHPGIGRIIVMQDITHFKETDKLKTELVATVSHDLKQPLSVMRGYLDLLRMTNEFDDRSQRYTENLEYAFSNMRQLIDDLLDIARIESGLNLEFAPVDLAEILRRCLLHNKPIADGKSQTIQLSVPENLPEVNADDLRLQQIFSNLISNAIKYTPPEGEIKIYTELKTDIVRIYVVDNGLGIGPEDLSQIFERFYRVRRPETDSIEGTGLGLAIVKSLVEAHKGKIDVQSELGKGSTFRVMLPLY